MEDLAAEFCRRAKERPGFRYSKELRRLAVEYTRQSREQEYSWRQIAERLGLSESAVADWLRREREPEASRCLRVHEVKLTEPAALIGGPVLVMPSGARIEGIAMSDLVDLLRALG